MTPLAARVAKELLLPEKKRAIQDADGAVSVGLLSRDTHCFDIGSATDVMVNTLSEVAWADVEPLIGELFLPSPVTWLEPVGYSPIPMAYVLRKEDEFFAVYYFHADENGITAMALGKFRAKEDGASEIIPAEGLSLVWSDDLLNGHSLASVVSRCAIILSLINAEVAGTLSHAAHRGLARKLRKHNLPAGHIDKWSEVVLRLDATATVSSEGDRANATRRCLHFVRSHIRRLSPTATTIVKAHWKGDAELGVKGTRYKVVG